MTLEADVVVVGAGLAGLTAGRDLARADRDVVVLEARDRVGGRVLNHRLGDQQVVEVGGQFVGPGQDHVLELARELDIATFDVYDRGRHVLVDQGQHLTYRLAPGLSPRVLAGAARAFFRLDRASRRVPLERPWEAHDALVLDGQTFESWIRDNVGTARARDMVRLAFRTMLAAEPSDVSALHVLFFLHSGGGFRSLTEVTGGAQQSRFVGGSQRLAEALAAQLGDRVRLGEPVRALSWESDRVTVTTDRGIVLARRAIVAIPPTLAGRLTYEPALPPERDQLTQRVPHGAVTKVNAIYDTPWWRELGLSGQSASDRGVISATFDNTPPSGTPGILMGFVEGRAALELGAQEPAAGRRVLLGELARLFGPRAERVRELVVTDWAVEPWTRGCYGANFPPGAWTNLGHALRRPIGPLHWAGTETAEGWALYMDGAVASGHRAAAEVLEYV